GRALFGFDDLKLPGDALLFAQDKLIAPGEFSQLLLESGGFLGALFGFGLHGREFFASHDRFGRTALELLVQRLDIRLRGSELLLQSRLLLLQSRLLLLEALILLLTRLQLLLQILRAFLAFGQQGLLFGSL